MPFYNLPSLFNKGKKGISMGLGREFSDKVFREGGVPGDPKFPAPNKYNTQEMINIYAPRAPKYTIAGRHDDKVKSTKFLPVPGPGAYDCKLFNAKGKYVSSKFSNITSVSWQNGIKSKRFNYSGNITNINYL